MIVNFFGQDTTMTDRPCHAEANQSSKMRHLEHIPEGEAQPHRPSVRPGIRVVHEKAPPVPPLLPVERRGGQVG
jgi:hypothetical protein